MTQRIYAVFGDFIYKNPEILSIISHIMGINLQTLFVNDSTWPQGYKAPDREESNAAHSSFICLPRLATLCIKQGRRQGLR